MNTSLKRILNATWKVGLGLIGLSALVIGILVANVWHEEKYGRAYWKDKTLSKNVIAKGYNNNRMRVWNSKTARYTTEKVRWVSGRPERDSITVYCDTDGNRGFLNCNTGEITLPAEKFRYCRAWQFSRGRAFVICNDDEEEGVLSIIDHEGNIVMTGLPWICGSDYVFDDAGLCWMKDGDDKRGILRIDGTWALEMKYRNINYANGEGYRTVTDSTGMYLFDPSFNLVFPEPHEWIDYASGRDGAVFVVDNHQKKLVAYDGTVLEPFVIDSTNDLKYCTKYIEETSDEYELIQDVVAYRVDGWEGLMDKRTGKPITPAKYHDITMISKDLIQAQLNYAEGSVVMDRSGNIVKQ